MYTGLKTVINVKKERKRAGLHYTAM